MPRLITQEKDDEQEAMRNALFWPAIPAGGTRGCRHLPSAGGVARDPLAGDVDDEGGGRRRRDGAAAEISGEQHLPMLKGTKRGRRRRRGLTKMPHLLKYYTRTHITMFLFDVKQTGGPVLLHLLFQQQSKIDNRQDCGGNPKNIMHQNMAMSRKPGTIIKNETTWR